MASSCAWSAAISTAGARSRSIWPGANWLIAAVHRSAPTSASLGRSSPSREHGVADRDRREGRIRAEEHGPPPVHHPRRQGSPILAATDGRRVAFTLSRRSAMSATLLVPTRPRSPIP